MGHPHSAGSLAMYEGRPTVVGGKRLSNGTEGDEVQSNKTEQLNGKWEELTDHPRYFFNLFRS